MAEEDAAREGAQLYVRSGGEARKKQIEERAAEKGLDLNVICFKKEPLDEALQRFLQARKFDLENTLKCIEDAIRWRSENASNIWYEQTGSVDLTALHCLTTNEKFTKYHVCLMEELQDKYAESTELFQRTINKTLSILDLRGLTMAKLNSDTLNFVKCVAEVDSNNYPETMGKMLIINAPAIFQVTWKMIKGFLDPRTVSKIEIFGDEKSWKARLAELVEQDQLPAELGGTGPPCLSLENPFTEKEMASGTSVEEVLSVKSGDFITYRFFTRPAGNITFKLVFKPTANAQEPVELVPSRAFTEAECSNGSVVSGTVDCPADGEIQAVWEHPNWWSRTLLYRVFKEEAKKA
ncbi:Phosphatidylinositol/phosphatidylcholine transfer protein SFH2 [Hondaea fermentalgiana]|uniref:Phosphatidylinositol/phosphatidylcholine transfer protein SFH2 n=1 Tax=Hondaea fermentalgiana TaxID=2315210 RepID=A0A2R5GSX5_9STRA|nr:Phosphatidylinositol/phosphatidylcholine transfer protein SFH2 [Hondaea fermentalgiana]|eukprot:GBG31481.1 Phosphatidylinositol/phosphatidylcholine transfer protein SFH2 [Hondaea fermentalgiana]